MNNYRICTRCIMDTSDPYISFDEYGYCNHCNNYFAYAAPFLAQKEKNKKTLKNFIEEMKRRGKKNNYDCILGVSGGVDSTYLAYKLKEWGLRILAVHMDNGWNSEIAYSNIEKTMKKLSIDLTTNVLDWEEFSNLQIAFLKASTPDSEIPTDHAILATIYNCAKKENIKYIIRGTNLSTEFILPSSWSQAHFDYKYINSINNKFGAHPLKTYPHFNIINWYIRRKIFDIKTIAPLDYIDYDKNEAMQLIKDKLGWTYYDGKHYESIYTRFYQGYILPTKFGFDKRRAHISSLICSNQISREEGLHEISKSPYPSESLLLQDKEYVLKKLRMDNKEFERIMNLQKKVFFDYPSLSKAWWYKFILSIFKKVKGIPW